MNHEHDNDSHEDSGHIFKEFSLPRTHETALEFLDFLRKKIPAIRDLTTQALHSILHKEPERSVSITTAESLLQHYGHLYNTILRKSKENEQEIQRDPVMNIICADVLPALEEFFWKSDAENIKDMERIGADLSDACGKAISLEVLRRPWFASFRPRSPYFSANHRIVSGLNEEVLKQRGKILLQNRDRLHTHNDYFTSFDLYDIVDHGELSTDDDISVPYAFVRHFYPCENAQSNSGGVWNPHLKIASVNADSMSRGATEEMQVHRKGLPAIAYTNLAASARYANIAFRGKVASTYYQSDAEAVTGTLHEAMIEEVRHGVNNLRFKRARGISPKARPDEYLRYHAPERGTVSLRQEVRNALLCVRLMLQKKQYSPQSVEADIRSIIEELNVNCTVGATGPAPKMMFARYAGTVIEVACLKDNGDIREIPDWMSQEVTEAMVGLNIIGSKVGVPYVPVTEKWDAFIEIGNRVLNVDDRDLRLHLKTWYKRCFLHGDVDEAPFTQILPDGELQARTVGIPLHWDINVQP